MIHRRLKAVIDRLALRIILPKTKLGDTRRYAAKQWSKLDVYLADRRIETASLTPANWLRARQGNPILKAA